MKPKMKVMKSRVKKHKSRGWISLERYHWLMMPHIRYKCVGNRIVCGKDSWEPEENLTSKERHETLLVSCLADESARHEFHIRLLGPHSGCMDFHLVRDESESFIMEAMDCDRNPFPLLIEWLEDICTNPEKKHTVICEDDCHFHLFLYMPAVTEDGKAALIMDEQIYNEKRDTFNIIADAKTIVREFYKGFMELDEKTRDELGYESVNKWDIFDYTGKVDNENDIYDEYEHYHPFYANFDYDLFREAIRSKNIEKYLAENFNI